MGISRRTWFVIALVLALGLSSPSPDAQGQTLAEGPDLAAAALVEQTKLTANDATAGAFLGWTVATSGDTALVGAPYESGARGAAYVFIRSGSSWVLQQKLTANDRTTGATFGASVAISGDRAVIGRLHSGGVGPSIGWAYVFERSGGVWTQQAKLTASDGVSDDEFGTSVAISGDTLFIGAFGVGNLRGAAYVFVRSGGAWIQQQKLSASDGVAGDAFGGIGQGIALDGDTAVIGAYQKHGAFNYQGAAYVFARGASGWAEVAKLTASDAMLSDEFGYAVAIDGSTILVGRRGGTSAYVFTRNAGVWSEQAILDAAGFEGAGVALAGDTAVVGAPTHGCCFQGAAFVFRRNANVWGFAGELNASDRRGGDGLGQGVAIAGDQVLAGAYGADLPLQNQGAVYVFAQPAAPQVPGAPTLTGSVNGTTVTISWTPSTAGAPPTSYIVQAGTAPGASNVFNRNVGATTTLSATVAPGAYYVRVLAANAVGSSAPSNEVTLIVGGVPGQPSVTSAIASGAVLTVAWLAGAGPVPTSHRLDFYAGAALVATVNAGGGTSIGLPIPPGTQGTFGVRVTALNGAVAGPPSALYTFSIGPACTTPASPSVSGAVVGGTASVSWPAVPGATAYILSAGTSPGGTQFMAATNIGGTLGASASGLPSGFTAWVRVIAVNACGQQSAPRDFLVQ